MSSRDSSSRKGKERATDYGDYQEVHLVGKGRKGQNANQSHLDSTSPTKKPAYQRTAPRTPLELRGEQPQYHSSNGSPTLARSDVGDLPPPVPSTPLFATSPMPTYQAHIPITWPDSRLLMQPTYPIGGEIAHSYDQPSDRGMSGPSVLNSEYPPSFHSPGYNVSQIPQLDCNQQPPLQYHQPYFAGPYAQAEEAANGAVTTALGGLATGDRNQPYKDNTHRGEPSRVKEKRKFWSEQETYLLTAIGAAQLSWDVKTKYFPGHNLDSCKQKYWKEVERIRASRKEAGDESAFASGKARHPIWGLETDRTIDDMIFRGASSQELTQYLKNQGIKSSDDTQAGSLQTVETLEERSSKKFGPSGWSEREDIILVKFRAEGLAWHEVSERLPGRTFAACANRWTKISQEKRDRLMQVSEV